MPQADNDGVVIEYDTIGTHDHPALLLIMGFATQLTAWDREFCQLLASHGFFVIRFDNRDCGLSGKTDGEPPNIMALMMAVMAGNEVTEEVPYTLSDMAADGLAVLDHLGIDQAHIAGASMGGMIAQQMAIDHPDRVLSLTSIMSTTGDSSVGQGTQEAVGALFSPPPEDRDSVIERGLTIAGVVCGPHFDEAEARIRIGDAFDRSFHPQGGPFQLAAIAKTGDRTENLRALDVPTLVIHGEVDTLVDVSGGEATAAAIGGAKLLTFDDMGHDLPKPRWPEITAAIAELAASARR
ncbi:MAG: alpha/beta hydrolase [Acidimicrobiia bacterium]|nr:alpha/beta hydrolase [Acidimicrobiia bacterium]